MNVNGFSIDEDNDPRVPRYRFKAPPAASPLDLYGNGFAYQPSDSVDVISTRPSSLRSGNDAGRQIEDPNDGLPYSIPHGTVGKAVAPLVERLSQVGESETPWADLSGMGRVKAAASAVAGAPARFLGYGIEGTAGFLDSFERGLKGQRMVDPVSGEEVSPGVGGVGLDRFDVLAIPGTGVIGSAVTHAAERAAARSGKRPGETGPALAANHAPRADRIGLPDMPRVSGRPPIDLFELSPDVLIPGHVRQMADNLGGRATRQDGFHVISVPDGRSVAIRMQGEGPAPAYRANSVPVVDAVGKRPAEVRAGVDRALGIERPGDPFPVDPNGQMRLFSNRGGEAERTALRGVANNDQTPFYGEHVGPRGRVADPAGEAERLRLESGVAGSPTPEGFFNPATSALLQGGVAPRQTVAYYRKQMQSRGGKLPPGHWEEATAGLKPSDVISRDELVSRLDSQAPALERRTVSSREFKAQEDRRNELHAAWDTAATALPNYGLYNPPAIRSVLDNGGRLENGRVLTPDEQALYRTYLEAFDAANRYGTRPASEYAVEPRWHGYITDGFDPHETNYRETAIGYRMKEPTDWAIDRGVDDPRAADRMARAMEEDGVGALPGVDPESSAMQIARGVTDKLSGNVEPFTDAAHMGHMGHMGGARDGPNLEGWTRTQDISVPPRAFGSVHEAAVDAADRASRFVRVVEEAQDQRRRMVSKQGMKPSADRMKELHARRDELEGEYALAQSDAARFLDGPDIRALVSSPALDPVRARLDLRDVLREVNYESSINFNRQYVVDALGTDRPMPELLRMIASMVLQHPGGHVASPDLRARIDAALSAEMASARSQSTPLNRLRHAHAGQWKLDGSEDVPSILTELQGGGYLPSGSGSLSEQAAALSGRLDRARESLANVASEITAAGRGVASSPYTHSKPAAAGLLAREAVRDASEAGAQHLAWPTGPEQAVRFGVGSHASRLAYDPASHSLWFVRRDGPGSNGDGFERVPERVPPERLSEFVGADVARELMKQERGDVTVVTRGSRGRPVTLGQGHILDLTQGVTFGGKGMRSFYGENGSDGGLFGGQVVSTLRKLDPSSDPRIEPVNVRPGGLEPIVDNRFPSVRISDAARDKARRIGVSLYANKGGEELGAARAAAVGDRSGRSVPPTDEAQYIDARSYRDGLSRPYRDGASSRTTPWDGDVPTEGTWRIDDFRGIHGRGIEQLRRVSVDDVLAPETVNGLDPMKAGDDVRYAGWIEEGRRPPPIETMEVVGRDGQRRLSIMDGHRRHLAAKRSGETEIDAWVSPLADHPDGLRDSQGRPMLTGLTYEIAKRNPGVKYANRGGEAERGAMRGSAMDDAVSSWERERWDDLSANERTFIDPEDAGARGDSYRGPMFDDPPEVRALFDAARKMEDDLTKAGKSPAEIASALSRKFGSPVSADDLSRGDVWWRASEAVSRKAASDVDPGSPAPRSPSPRRWSHEVVSFVGSPDGAKLSNAALARELGSRFDVLTTARQVAAYREVNGLDNPLRNYDEAEKGRLRELVAKGHDWRDVARMVRKEMGREVQGSSLKTSFRRSGDDNLKAARAEGRKARAERGAKQSAGRAQTRANRERDMPTHPDPNVARAIELAYEVGPAEAARRLEMTPGALGGLLNRARRAGFYAAPFAAAGAIDGFSQPEGGD